MFNNQRKRQSHQQKVSQMLQSLKNDQQMAKYRQAQQRQQIMGAPGKVAGAINTVQQIGPNLNKAGSWLSKSSNPTMQNLGSNLTNMGNNISNATNNQTLQNVGNVAGKVANGMNVVGGAMNTYNSAKKGDYAGTGINAADTAYKGYQLGSKIAAEKAGQKAGEMAAQKLGEVAAEKAAEAGTDAAVNAGAQAAATAGTEAGATAAAGAAGPPGWVIAAIIEAAKMAKGALVDSKQNIANNLANDALSKATQDATSNYADTKSKFGNNDISSAINGTYQSDLDNALDSQSYQDLQKKDSDKDSAANMMNERAAYLNGMKEVEDAENVKNYIGSKLGLGKDGNKIMNAGSSMLKLGMKLNPIYQAMHFFDKQSAKNAERAIEEGNRSSRISQEALANDRNEFQDAAKQNISNMVQDNNLNEQIAEQEQTQPTDSTSQSIMDRMKTNLGIGDEAGYQIAKDNSRFAGDNGTDYDLRGFYNQYQNAPQDGGLTEMYNPLTPTATNGHLTDEYKLPNHKTFSTDSNLANMGNGLENIAINPEGHQYVEDMQNINSDITPYQDDRDSLQRVEDSAYSNPLSNDTIANLISKYTTPNLNDNSSIGINTPTDTQSLQNDPRTVSQNEGLVTGGASNVNNNSNVEQRITDNVIPSGNGYNGTLPNLNHQPQQVQPVQQETQQPVQQRTTTEDGMPTTREGFVKSLQDKGWNEDTINAALEGKNLGNKDMANWINLYNQTANEGEKLGAGQSNYGTPTGEETTITEDTVKKATHPVAQRMLQGVRNGLSDFYNGYQDNLLNSFKQGDLANSIGMNNSETGKTKDGALTGGASATKKNIMNRIGEAIGTTQRLAANPAIQGLASYALNRYNGESQLNSVTNALNWAGNKAKSDYYQQQMNPGSAPSIIGNYTKDDYNAHTNNGYKETMANNAQLKTKAQLDKTNPTMEDYANSMLSLGKANGGWDLDQYNAYINSENYNPTNRINLQAMKNGNTAYYNNGKLANDSRKIDITYELGKERNKISWQNARTAAGTLGEKIRHNHIMENKPNATSAKDAKKQELAANIVKYADFLDSHPNLSESEYKKYRNRMIKEYNTDFLTMEKQMGL